MESFSSNEVSGEIIEILNIFSSNRKKTISGQNIPLENLQMMEVRGQ